MPWSQKLARPLKVIDGPTLTTLREARDYLLTLDRNYGFKPEWQSAVAKMLEASKSGNTAAATKGLEDALLLNAMLDM